MNQPLRIFIAILGILILIGIAYFWLQPVTQNESSATSENAIRVAASHFVLEDTLKVVAADAATIIPMQQGDVSSHDFEPTPRQVADLYALDAFFYNGAGLDAWAEKLAPELEARGVKVVNLSKHISLRAASSEGEENHDHDTSAEAVDDHGHDEEEIHNDEHGATEPTKEQEEDHDHGPNDPHYWLDPHNMEIVATVMAKTLAEIDSTHASTYTKNAEERITQVELLDQQTHDSLETCENREIIVAHEAFQYFGAAYTIDIHAIAGIEPESEPSNAHVAELIEEAKEHGITTIFFESQANPRLAETIANEINGTTALLNPIEGLAANDATNATYLTLMQQNVRNLHAAMRCTSALQF